MRKMKLAAVFLVLIFVLSACILSEDPNLTVIKNEEMEMTLFSLEEVEKNGQAYYEIEAEIENRLDARLAVEMSEFKTDGTVVNDTVFYEGNVPAEETKKMTLKAKINAESTLDEKLEFIVDVQAKSGNDYKEKHQVNIAY